MTGCGRKIGPHACCTVVCGDCLELMKALSDGCVDVVITDPPYNLGKDYGGNADDHKDASSFAQFIDRTMSEIFRLATTVLLSPGIANLSAYLKHRPRWVLAWHKPFGVSHSPVGFNNWEPILFWGMWPRKNWSDYIYAPLHLADKALGFHACPKPVNLFIELVERFSSNESTVLDPFLGSGTTAVAAKKLGRHFLGFEISPEYCKIAEGRIALAEAQPNLFQPKPEQGELICPGS